MALLQQQLEGKYEILEKIKEGGMGAVYKVRHRFLDEIRVVKVIRPALEQSPEISDRFLREARMAIRLRHPSIAVLHDFAVGDGGQAFIVMEYIDGLTLEELLMSGGPPPLGLALQVAAQALRAMGYLHRHGFVHRDIAPDNLMLTRGVDGEPLVKLIDLGIAKLLAGEGAATSTGIFLGKPRYASPEHFGTREMDHRSDLYSFGVVFYELLTGQCPVAGHDPASYMAGHLFRPPLDFAESDPRGTLPAELRGIVLRALAKTADERFASAAELADALAPFAERFPVQAGDLDAALRPAAAKTAPWSTPAPVGSSQVLLDQQFLVGTTPPPVTPVPAARPAATAAPAAPSAPNQALDDTLPLTAHRKMPEPPPAQARGQAPPRMQVPSPGSAPLPGSALPLGSVQPSGSASSPRPAPPPGSLPPPSPGSLPPPSPTRAPASLAARTLAGVRPAEPPGAGAGELFLPAAHGQQAAGQAPAAEDWEARRLHRTGPPPASPPTPTSGNASPTLSFKQPATAPARSAAQAAWSGAASVETGKRAAWAWVAGALTLAGLLAGGVWWYRRPQAPAGQAGLLRPAAAPTATAPTATTPAAPASTSAAPPAAPASAAAPTAAAASTAAARAGQPGTTSFGSPKPRVAKAAAPDGPVAGGRRAGRRHHAGSTRLSTRIARDHTGSRRSVSATRGYGHSSISADARRPAATDRGARLAHTRAGAGPHRNFRQGRQPRARLPSLLPARAPGARRGGRRAGRRARGDLSGGGARQRQERQRVAGGAGGRARQGGRRAGQAGRRLEPRLQRGGGRGGAPGAFPTRDQERRARAFVERADDRVR